MAFATKLSTSLALQQLTISLPHSSSLFGIKPSTPTPSSTSIFGNTATKPAQGSLFGGTNTQPTTTMFANQQQTQTPNFFGGGQAQQPAAPVSLFGQPTQQHAQPGLFGQPAQQQQQQQPQQPNSVPANFFATSQLQQPQQQGLFGQAQPSNTSFFGANAQPTNQPGQQQQQQQQPSLFGSFGPSLNTNIAQQQQPQQGLWGATSNTAINPLQRQQTQPVNTFGPSPFASQTQKPQQQLGLSTAPQQVAPPFTKSTRFNDLPDEVKKTFEMIDSHIQGRIQISKDIHKRKLGEEATKGQELLRSVHKELLNSTSIIHSDLLFTQDLNAKTDQAVQDTIVATQIVDGFRNPQQHGSYLKDHSNFPLEFFTRVTVQMRERLVWYKSTIDQIERKLSSAASQTQYNPQAIASTMQAQHATFIALASKTAALDAELQKIKALYTQLWRTKTGSMRDPFNDLDRNSDGDFGLESLSV